MSAMKEFAIALETAELAADQASYQLTTELAALSNLVWRAGRTEGPDRQTPVTAIDPDWIEAMVGQLQEALVSLQELQSANECLVRQDYFDSRVGDPSSPFWCGAYA